MLTIGCHLSASEGFLAMGKTALSIGANTFQFFTRNPRGSKAKAIDPDDAAAFLALAQANGFGRLVAHAPYTINPCSKTERTREFARMTLADDLKRMEYLPGNYYNFHPGSHTEQGMEVGVSQIAETLNAILKPEQHTTVLLETMSGKGSEVGGRFEELREILDRVALNTQMGVCMDTCHISDAGYDIAGDIDGVLTEFDRVIGLERLKAVHINDSMNPLGAHKDRHARIGEGYLGEAAFGRIINHPALRDLPFILETPNDLAGYAREIGRQGAEGGMMLRLSALFLGLLGLVGLYFHSTLPVTGRIRPGFFVFYTNLSNLLLAVYQLTLGVSGHDPQCGVFRWLSSAGVALSMTLCIFVTHLIYQWVLVPSAKKGGKALSDIGFSSFGNLCVHYAVPWLTVVQWLLWQDKSGLAIGHAVWWLVLPLAYFAFGMARGATGKPIGHTKRCYPYPFMEPQVMGKRFWPVVLLLIAAFFGLGCLFVGISRLL